MYHKIQFPSPPFSYHICLLVLGLFAGDATVPGMSWALLDRSLASQRRRQLFVADLRCELLGSLEAGPRIPRTGSSEPIIDLTRVYAPFVVRCVWPLLRRLSSGRAAGDGGGSVSPRWLPPSNNQLDCHSYMSPLDCHQTCPT